MRFTYLWILLLVLALSLFGQTSVVKIMAANITSGNAQCYENPGIRIFQGLKPDICCIQEFNYNGSISELVQKAFGTNYSFYREPYNDSGDIPNGIIYRNDFKLLDSGSWTDPGISNRGFAYVKLDVPGAGNPNMLVVSVHFSTQSDKQVAGARALYKKIYSYYNATKIEQITDYIVLAGDFNAGSRSAQILNVLKSESGGMFVDNPIPTDQQGNQKTNATRAKDLDFVLVNPLLYQQQTTLVVGSNSFSKGLVFDSRVYNPLSDVSPVYREDSGATNMQHMAVMKAFMLPMSMEIEELEVK